MGKILWMLLLTLCLLKISHAQILNTGGVKTATDSKAFNFFDDPDFIYLRDPEFQQPRAQTPGPITLTTPPKEINLLNIDSVKTAGSTPIPTTSTSLTTYQVTLANLDQGKTQSGNLDGVGMLINHRDLQDKNPVSSTALQPSNIQGTGIKKESGNANSQANILKNLMDLEGESLVLFILQHQKGNSIFKNLLGNREKNGLLEAANRSLVMEGVLCKGPLGGLCGHGSLMGLNAIMKKKFPSEDSDWIKIKDSKILQLSWKNTAASTTNMEFMIRLTVKLSWLFNMFEDIRIYVKIEIPTKVQNTKIDQPLLSMMDCKPKITSVKVGVSHSPVIEIMVKLALKKPLSRMMCLLTNFWFEMINQQMKILQYLQPPKPNLEISVLTQPSPPGKSYRIDMQNENFLVKFLRTIITALEIKI